MFSSLFNKNTLTYAMLGTFLYPYKRAGFLNIWCRLIKELKTWCSLIKELKSWCTLVKELNQNDIIKLHQVFNFYLTFGLP